MVHYYSKHVLKKIKKGSLFYLKIKNYNLFIFVWKKLINLNLFRKIKIKLYFNFLNKI